MDRATQQSAGRSRRNPHARGDGPIDAIIRQFRMGKSPRAWGWTVVGDVLPDEAVEIPTRVGMDRSDHEDQNYRQEIPTRVGMDRPSVKRPAIAARNPHARGDGPDGQLISAEQKTKSPRAWGWTDAVDRIRATEEEIPTRVGMDRRKGRR